MTKYSISKTYFILIYIAGVHFDTSSSIISEISTAIKVFAYGVESYLSETANLRYPLGTRLSCDSAGSGEARWSTGERFYRHLRNVSVEGEAGRPSIEFTSDGELQATELKIMNLRPTIGDQVTSLGMIFSKYFFTYNLQGLH